MSISVSSNSSFNIPSIVYSTNSGLTVGSIISDTNIYTVPNPTASSLYRVSLLMSVPSSATGQSVILSSYTTDPNGILTKITTGAVTPGNSVTIIGTYLSVPGTTLRISIVPNGADTIVNRYQYCIIVENV